MKSVLPSSPALLLRQWWSTYAFVLLAYAGSRVVAHLGIAIAAFLDPVLSRTTAFHTWDTAFYLDNARYGYPLEPTGRIAFFPGFPWVIDVSRWITGFSYEWSAVVASTLLGIVTVILLRKLAFLVTESSDVANRTVLLFVFFPGAFVFSLPYSESLMIPLALGSLIALRKKHWIIAGVLAAFATATRSIALALVLAAMWASFQAIRKDRDWRSLAAPLLAPLGMIGYLYWIHVQYGSYTWWQRVQEEWGQRVSPMSPLTFLGNAMESRLLLLNYSIIVAGMVCLLILGLWALIRRTSIPGELWAYVIGVLGVVLSSLPLMTKPRFILTAFPLFLLLAKLSSDRVAQVLVGVFGGLLALILPLVILTLAFTP